MRSLMSYYSPRNFASEILNNMEWVLNQDEHLSDQVNDVRGFDPPSEILEAKDHYLLNFDLPGMKKEEIKIETEQNTLSVSGERKRDAFAEKGQIRQSFERSFGYFNKSFTLPSGVQAEQIEAHFENGVLSLYIPKLAAAQKKQIEIQSGKPSNLLKKDPGAVKETSK